LFTKSRKVVALGLVAALGAASIALAGPPTGADLNDAGVVSKVKPSKLSKKKFSRISTKLGVINSPDSAGNEAGNAAAERIAWSKNIKINLSARPACDADLPNGIPTAQAKAMCPPRSVIGTGTARVHAPGATCTPPQAEPCLAATQVVTVFNGGPGSANLQLHTYGEPPDGLGGLSPTVDARVVRANAQERNQGYGQALSVPNTPVTGALKITYFDAIIGRNTGVAKAKCKPRKFKWRRTVTYTDDSSERASKTQRCKVKRRR
jgi:hypothetical protein